MSSHYSFFSLYVHEALGLSTVSLFWATGPAAEVPFLFFSGSIIRRFGIPAAMMVALGAIAVRLILYALVPVFWVILVAQLLHALTFGFSHASGVAFIFKTVPEDRRVMAMALFLSLSQGCALFIGSTVGGFVIEAWGFFRPVSSVRPSTCSGFGSADVKSTALGESVGHWCWVSSDGCGTTMMTVSGRCGRPSGPSPASGRPHS